MEMKMDVNDAALFGGGGDGETVGGGGAKGDGPARRAKRSP